MSGQAGSEIKFGTNLRICHSVPTQKRATGASDDAGRLQQELAAAKENLAKAEARERDASESAAKATEDKNAAERDAAEQVEIQIFNQNLIHSRQISTKFHQTSSYFCSRL